MLVIYTSSTTLRYTATRSPRDHIIMAPIRSKATEVNIIRKWMDPTDRPCRVRNSWPPTHLMRCSHPSQWGDESYIRQTKHTHTHKQSYAIAPPKSNSNSPLSSHLITIDMESHFLRAAALFRFLRGVVIIAYS